jgi:hypothetical protein
MPPTRHSTSTLSKWLAMWIEVENWPRKRPKTTPPVVEVGEGTRCEPQPPKDTTSGGPALSTCNMPHRHATPPGRIRNQMRAPHRAISTRSRKHLTKPQLCPCRGENRRQCRRSAAPGLRGGGGGRRRSTLILKPSWRAGSPVWAWN